VFTGQRLCAGTPICRWGTLDGMGATVNVNGRVFDQEHAVISVFDHGFLYGEGIYETLRTYNGEPFLFDRHMRRLRASAAMLSLAVPLDNEQIAARFRDTMQAASLGDNGQEAYIRILITRGIGELTYDPSDAYERGVKVAIVGIVRNHPDTVNPLIKSNNLLNTALAAQEAIRKGAFEGVMRNYRGELAECTTANLFVVKSGAALTPPLDAGLLAGITREFVFEVGARIGVPVREQVLRDDDLFGADEAFLTSTTRELVPITRVDDRTIATGKSGPITHALLDEFRKLAWSGLSSAVRT
jgi:branched-chain amino acid aminotransferase